MAPRLGGSLNRNDLFFGSDDCMQYIGPAHNLPVEPLVPRDYLARISFDAEALVAFAYILKPKHWLGTTQFFLGTPPLVP